MDGRREGDRVATIPNLTDTQKIFASIIENQVSINTAVNDLQEIQAKHHKLLVEGNGEIPLIERVRTHETFIGELRYWSKFIFGAILLQTVTFGIAIVVAVIRFLPALESLVKNP